MKKTVLIVDDNAGLRHNLQFTIKRAGYDVLEAENGLHAIDIMRSRRPDIIITDVMMPDMNGFEFLQHLRSSSEGYIIPVIMLTSKSLPTEIREAMALGADDYLVKPVAGKELLNVIQTRLERYEQHQKALAIQIDGVQAHLTAILPHELRTPLSGILGAATLIRKELPHLDKEEIFELNECILQSAGRLKRMTENFLLYGEIRLLLNQSTFLPTYQEHPAQHIEASLHEIMGSLSQYPSSKNCVINVQEQSLALQQSHFEKIVYEVCLNAYMFSPAASSVTITSRMNNGLYSLDITNPGRGFTGEQIRQLSEPLTTFVQFERQRFEQQGTGLGLSLVRCLLALYGGSFAIQSMIDQKTTVSLGFPVAPSA